jgi:hypothetical protein
VDSRVLIPAYCQRRRRAGQHVLAELLAGDPLRIRIKHVAYGHAKGGRIVNARGGPLEEPLDLSMSYLAMCSCGVHQIRGADLDRDWRAGKKAAIARLVLL